MSKRYNKKQKEAQSPNRFGDEFDKGKRTVWGKGWQFTQNDWENAPDDLYIPNLEGQGRSDEKFNYELTKRVITHKLPMWRKYAAVNIRKIMERTGPSKKEVQKLHFTVLRDRFILKPTIILGYGPSFHNNIENLKKINLDKCNLIATDRTLPILLKNGIHPQYAINLDSGDQILPFYRELDTQNIVAIFALTTNPHSWEWFKGPKTWFAPAIYPWKNNTSEEIQNMTGYYPIPTCGNVGTTAMMIAFCLGARPIYLLGMDFCYDPHKDVADLNAAKAFKNFQVGEEEIKTDSSLLAYATSTKRLLMKEGLSDQFLERPVVNLSRGLLRGTYIRVATMDDFLMAVDAFDANEWVKEIDQRRMDGSIKKYMISFNNVKAEPREGD